MSSYFDVTTYATWASNMYNWVSTAGNALAPPPGVTTNEKPWLPEGLCVLTQLALLNLYPCGYASALEWPKGAKVGFEKHCLSIYQPSLSQKFSRTIWGAAKIDLVKLPQAITISILMQPPTKIPGDINLHERTILDLLKSDRYQFDNITRIYLYAMNAIKKLAQTYGYLDFNLSEPVHDITDALELKYLKHSYQLLNSVLHGKTPEGFELPEIGVKARKSWEEADFVEVNRHLGEGLNHKWDSHEAKTHRYSIEVLVSRQVERYVKLCRLSCLALAPMEENKPPEKMTTSSPAALEQTSSSLLPQQGKMKLIIQEENKQLAASASSAQTTSKKVVGQTKEQGKPLAASTSSAQTTSKKEE